MKRSKYNFYKSNIPFKTMMMIMFCWIMISCQSKPTVVEPVNKTEENATKPEAENTSTHKVVVEEVIHTTKYTYLSVKENNLDPYWIAISKADVNKGEQLMYTGGLKMRGFKSTELDRIFDEVILVSNISSADKSKSMSEKDMFTKMKSENAAVKSEKIPIVKGSTGIAEILTHPEKFDGKTVTVAGRCTKINHQIMNRNWIHLSDGSKKNHELTITSQDVIAVGEAGVFEGKISINKDFGAGYRYDVIMEEAVKK